MSSGEVPTERLELPDPTNAMGPAELASPRVRERSREAGNELVDGGGREFAEEPAWRVAAEALLSAEGAVLGGPWPVRKYLLLDGIPGGGEHADQYIGLLRALTMTGLDYTVGAYRPWGCEWRGVVVTWGWAVSLTLEAIADELALIYDRGGVS
jgi:hypothetical protein